MTLGRRVGAAQRLQQSDASDKANIGCGLSRPYSQTVSVVLALLLGHDQHAFLKDLLIYSSGIVLLFFTTGYFLTTMLARTLWRGQTLWSYSGVAAALFLIHFEVMNVGLGGAFEPSDRLRVRVLGTCIVLACTLAGSLALWPPGT